MGDPFHSPIEGVEWSLALQQLRLGGHFDRHLKQLMSRGPFKVSLERSMVIVFSVTGLR